MKKMLQLFVGFLMIGSMQAALAEIAPDEMVKKTADEVLTIIKQDKDIQAGNIAKITQVAEEKVLPNFNFDRTSRMVLGKHWRTASPEQKEAFKLQFRDLLIRTYASALSKYQNQTIEFKPMRMQPGDKEVVVRSEILQPGGQPIAVDYSLEKAGESWKVYDIVIEGVSLVTNYRGQFSEEVKRSGLDGLIQKLSEKNKAS
ncbi:MAG TPA: ABC transporter substrate-binding protein [Methylophilaceae bacterium]|nr:ABC transporter substrate-binding protein [Methylophilaceae bacterium]